MRGFLLLLILLPVVDLALMGHWIGFWNTLLLVIGTAVLGFALIRHQGMAALNQGRQKLAMGQPPIEELTTGLFLALAGVLFIHPGFITDALGLLCLIPGLRKLLAAWAIMRFARSAGTRADAFRGEDVIDGEFKEVADDETHRITRK